MVLEVNKLQPSYSRVWIPISSNFILSILFLLINQVVYIYNTAPTHILTINTLPHHFIFYKAFSFEAFLPSTKRNQHG